MDGQTILNRPAHKISEIGIGRTFQNVALFPNLTVRDNVRVGKHARTNSDIISDSLKLPWVRSGEAAINKDVNDILDYLDLHSVADTIVSGLPSARRSASNSRVRSPPNRRSCCSTSPQAVSTMRKSTSSAT